MSFAPQLVYLASSGLSFVCLLIIFCCCCCCCFSPGSSVGGSLSPPPPVVPAASLKTGGAGGFDNGRGGRAGDGAGEGTKDSKGKKNRKLSLRILPPELDVAMHGPQESAQDLWGTHEEMRMHGLPLRVFHSRCHMQPYLPMELLATRAPPPGHAANSPAAPASSSASGGSAAECCASSAGLLAGSSNRMFLLGSPHTRIDAVANAETGKVQINTDALRKAASLSVHERQVADALANAVEEHFRAKQRQRELREEAAVSSHLAAAAAAAAVVAGGQGGGFTAEVDALSPAPSFSDDDERVAEGVRSQLALYTLRLLQAAARQACTANWSPESLDRELAEHEMPRIHTAAWTAAWQATSNFDRWLAEHNPVIARHSKAPSSPVLLAAVKDSMKSGLLDFRQSLRESGGDSQMLALSVFQRAHACKKAANTARTPLICAHVWQWAPNLGYAKR